MKIYTLRIENKNYMAIKDKSEFLVPALSPYCPKQFIDFESFISGKDVVYVIGFCKLIIMFFSFNSCNLKFLRNRYEF